MSRPATIYEIAKTLGVSPKTVSRVLNNEPYVKDEVRRKVKETARALNYQPNFNARGLITRRSFLIGLTYERPNPFYAVDLQRGILDRLTGELYRMVILPFDKVTAHPQGLVDMLRSSGVDGVVLTPPACDLLPMLDELDRFGIRYARIAPHLAQDRGACALFDDIAAARDAADYLLDLGHRRFTVILGDPTHYATEARSEGYRQAFAARGLNFDAVVKEPGDFTFESGQAAMCRILERGPLSSAILAQNDDMAAGVLTIAQEAGLRVPEDVSITGFDDSDTARLVMPRLTTVRQPVPDMAKGACDGLLALLADGKAPPRPGHYHHRLCIGGSTGAPARP